MHCSQHCQGSTAYCRIQEMCSRYVFHWKQSEKLNQFHWSFQEMTFYVKNAASSFSNSNSFRVFSFGNYLSMLHTCMQFERQNCSDFFLFKFDPISFDLFSWWCSSVMSKSMLFLMSDFSRDILLCIHEIITFWCIPS